MAVKTLVHAGDKAHSGGRSRAFETPADLMEACEAYLEWNDSNPLMEEKPFHFQGQIIMSEVRKARAPTILALCSYLGIHKTTWHNYRKSEDEEFDLVCDEIESRIKTYKFEHAAAGLMNSTIIARDIGLVDKTEVNSTGTVTHVNYSPADYKQAELELGNKLDDLD